MPGTWTPLTHQPSFGVGTMLLLTDGTVMCQNSGTAHWYRLTPDISGNYVNGAWTQLADGPNAPLYFASAVLRDGRVFVAGGEFNNGQDVELLAAEIYNPQTNAWSTLPTPPGWTNIGDASCCVFPDGRVMIGSVNNNQCAVYDPVTNSWTAAASKLNSTTNEETWTLLQDQTILSVDCANHGLVHRDRTRDCSSGRPPLRDRRHGPHRTLHHATSLQPGGRMGQRSVVPATGARPDTWCEGCPRLSAAKWARVMRCRTR